MSTPDRDTGASDPDLLCVFRTGDEGLVAIVRSILDGENIPYVARNAELQDLFGAGRLGGSFNFAVGSVEFLVRPEDAERTRAVLDALKQGFLSGGAPDGPDAEKP